MERVQRETMFVRKMNRNDIGQLIGLLAAFRVSLAKLAGRQVLPDLVSAEAELDHYRDRKFPLFVAVGQHDKICGYLVCRVEGKVVWAESLFVAPKHRRKGMGSMLYEKAEKLAIRLGNETLYNWVHPNNERIIAFMKKRGYTVLNLIEVRRPRKNETGLGTIRVGQNDFAY